MKILLTLSVIALGLLIPSIAEAHGRKNQQKQIILVPSAQVNYGQQQFRQLNVGYSQGGCVQNQIPQAQIYSQGQIFFTPSYSQNVQFAPAPIIPGSTVIINNNQRSLLGGRFR